MDKLNLKFINIDNDTMKEIVAKKFSVVPSIVVMVEDEISLYTGNNTFEWFNIFATTINQEKPIDIKVDSSINFELNDTKGINEPQEQKTKSILELAAEISKSRED